MLSTTNQLNAYKELVAAGGLTTAPSCTKSAAAASQATSLASTLRGLILPSIQYPGTVSENVSQITAWSVGLDAVAVTSNMHAELLNTYAEPSALIQLSIGWDVHCRANDAAASELPISLAIANVAVPGALCDALDSLDTSSLTSAMSSINTTLAAGATASLASGQINDLDNAVSDFTRAMTTITAVQADVDDLYTTANSSVAAAQGAYNNAISVALINSSSSDASVASALTVITPPAVLAALRGGE